MKQSAYPALKNGNSRNTVGLGTSIGGRADRPGFVPVTTTREVDSADEKDPELERGNPDLNDRCIAPDITPKKREQLVERCRNIFYRYRDDSMRAEMKNLWIGIVRAYLGQKPNRTVQSVYQTIYVLKELFKQFHIVEPLVRKQLLGGDELFEYEAQHPGQEDDMAAATAIVHYQLRKYKIDRELQKAINIALLKGTSYLAPTWRKFVHKQWKPFPLQDPLKDNQEWFKRRVDEVTQGSPWLEFVPPEEVYSDGRVEDCRDSKYCFVQKIVSLAELKTLVREGWIDGKETAKLDPNGSTAAIDATYDKMRADGALWYDSGLDAQDEDPLHELLICWSNSGDEYVLLDPSGSSKGTLVRAMPLPKNEIPLLPLRNYSPVGRHWGIPELWPIVEDQRLLNDLTSMWADSVHLDNAGLWYANPDGQKALMGFNFRPGGVIRVNKMDDVRRVETSNVPSQLGENIMMLRQFMQSVTRATDTLGGTAPNVGTATMGTKLQNAASEGIADKVTNFAPIFGEAYQWMYQLNAMYLDKRVKFRVEGTDGTNSFMNVGPNVFGGDPDCRVKLADLLETSPEKVNALMTVSKVVLGNPLVNQSLFLEDLFRALGKKKPKMYLNNPATAQTDAQQEYEDWLGTGAINDPNPNEDVMTHLRLHQTQSGTIEFHSVPDEWQSVFMRHIAITAGYVQKMQEAQANSQMMPQGGGQAPQMGNAQANQSLGVPQTGASQQGEIAAPGGG